MSGDDDDDDEVMESLPLYLNTTLTPYLHTINNTPKDDQLKCKMKLKHGWLWVEQPSSPHHPTFDADRAEELSSRATKPSSASNQQLVFDFAQSRALVGEICSPLNDHFVMIKRKDAVILAPITGACELRSSLLPIDLASSPSSHINNPDNKQSRNLVLAATEEQRILPQFQKRETEEQQAARLSSYEHLHKVWEEEAWTAMNHYPEACQESSILSANLVNINTSNNDLDTLMTIHETEQFMLNMGFSVDE